MLTATVEIFKTNVTSKSKSRKVLKELGSLFPDCEANFDLDDCDHILRVEGDFSPSTVSDVVKRIGYDCEWLG